MRYCLAFGLAVCVALGLFWLMNYLILGGSRELADTESYRMVDFVRLQPEENLQTRQRSRPEPPPPDEPPPPPPQLQVQQAQTQSRQMQESFNMPKLNIPTNIAGGPFMGELVGGGAPTGDGELIPLVRLAPQYPRQAARAGISGWVKLRIMVNPDGSVRQARVMEAEPRGLFEAAAVTAAMRGRFRPRLVDGQAVESSGEYTVNFQLGG